MVSLFTDLIPFEEANAPPAIFYTGDTLPLLQVQFTYDNNTGPVDLTNAVVSVTVIAVGIQAASLYGLPVNVIDVANGICQFQLPQAFSLPPGVEEGTFSVQLVADFGFGVRQHTDPFDIIIRKSLGQSA